MRYTVKPWQRPRLAVTECIKKSEGDLLWPHPTCLGVLHINLDRMDPQHNLLLYGFVLMYIFDLKV